ncbi:MAG: VOC family protein [Flavobacteriaceae bacterium]|nr:VOC family protein [Flavobacteriaceae bacterium]
MKIKEITLYTNDIQKQRQFYRYVLDFEQLLDSPDKISFKAGTSILTFEYKLNVKPFHLAFNIPSNAIYDALIWLRKRTKVLDCEGKKIADFSNWKAKAIYFYDTDKNIIEFIARERIDIESDEAFTSRSILSISEMALATDNIEDIYEAINQIKPIPIFDGDFSRFCALGNDEGLFIIIDKTIKKWYPTMDEAFTSDFTIKGDYNFAFIDGKIEELN